MFLQAQERFNQGKLFSSSSYVRDLLKQYGNNGRKMELPQIDNDLYQRGMEYRAKEKAHYASLEDEHRNLQTQNGSLMQRLQDAETRINQQDRQLDILSAFVRDFKVEPFSSSAITTEYDEPPSTSDDRSGGHDDVEYPQPSEPVGAADQEPADPGRALPDETDGAEPDVDRPAD